MEHKEGYNPGFKGHHHTKEWREEHRKQMSGKNNPNYGLRGKDTPFYGKHHTEEWKKNRSGKDNPFYGKHHSETTKEKMRQHAVKRFSKRENHPMYGVHRYGKDNPMYEKHHSEEAKREMKLNHADFSGENNPMYGIHRYGKDAPMYGKHLSEKTKEKLRIKNRENSLKLWENFEYVKKIMEARQIKPNKAELKLNSILQEILPNEYALNVKADIMTLGRKIPDFVNINGQKKLIELYGNFWHSKELTQKKRGQTEEERIIYFNKCGWDTLIIWEKELKNLEQLKEKIVEFNEA